MGPVSLASAGSYPAGDARVIEKGRSDVDGTAKGVCVTALLIIAGAWAMEGRTDANVEEEAGGEKMTVEREEDESWVGAGRDGENGVGNFRFADVNRFDVGSHPLREIRSARLKTERR